MLNRFVLNTVVENTDSYVCYCTLLSPEARLQTHSISQKTETPVSGSGQLYFCAIPKMPFNLSNDTLQISLADE